MCERSLADGRCFLVLYREGSDTDEDDDEALSEFSDEQFSDSDDESVDEDRPTPAAAAASRKEAMDNLVAPLAPEEYGKMPASFHENSQRVGDAADEDQEEVEEQAITRSGLGGIDEYSKKEDAPFSMRPPILPRDKYEGVDSDDESDSDEDSGVGRNDLGSMKIGPLPSDEEDSDEDRPQVVGDIEIDMGEEEAEFLEFSRKALGISDKQWNEIIEERKERGGAWICNTHLHSSVLTNYWTFTAFVPTAVSGEGNSKKKTAASDEIASTGAPPSDHKPRMPQTGPRPNVNPNLDSFEAVMEAMEAELTKQKKPTSEPSKATSPGKAKAPAPTATSTLTQTAKLNQKKPANKDAKGKGKEKAKVSFAEDVNMGGEDSDIDIEAAMDAELKAALQSGDLDVDSDEEGDGLGGEGGMDYNLIKNFLESFKSQGGLAGPVGNLAGRLQGGWTLPRDDA
jgi:anti-sigma28 factor (negative regulator of flagellin synthesis)